MKAGLEVVTLRQGPFWNFIYLVGWRGGEAVVVDPAWDVQAILDAAGQQRMTIRGAIVTHGHHDHVNGLTELLEAVDVPVYVHASDRELVARDFGGAVEPVTDGFEIDLGGRATRVLHTPGHTPGSITVQIGDWILTGDTLHGHGPGRAGAFAGAPEMLSDSIERLRAGLPGQTRILPGHDTGHERSPTLAELLATNG